MHSFYRLSDPRDSSVDLERVTQTYTELFGVLGSMSVRAWSKPEIWLGSLAPKFARCSSLDAIDSFELTPDEMRRTLSSELDTIYTISDVGLFSQFLLASIRHSELASVFVPADLPRKTIVRSLRFADYFHYERDESRFPAGVSWLLASTTVCENWDAVFFVARDPELNERVTTLLSEISVP